MDDEPFPKFLSCRVCGQPHRFERLPPGVVASCVRCGTTMARRRRSSIAWTSAFTLAALLLYIPAFSFPILKLTLYGATSDDTVWDGVVMFYRSGEWVMAGIVVMASVVIPLVKLIGLFILATTTQFRWKRARMFRTWLYRAIDVIGRWAMLDVFVVSIWVAVVKLQNLGSVAPGSGLLPFGCVVLLTIMAAAAFDPQLIWEDEQCA